MKQLYVIFKNALAEYEWKCPASCKTTKDAERVFKRQFPELQFIRVIERKL